MNFFEINSNTTGREILVWMTKQQMIRIDLAERYNHYSYSSKNGESICYLKRLDQILSENSQSELEKRRIKHLYIENDDDYHDALIAVKTDGSLERIS